MAGKTSKKSAKVAKKAAFLLLTPGHVVGDDRADRGSEQQKGFPRAIPTSDATRDARGCPLRVASSGRLQRAQRSSETNPARFH
jgi:hypothetical protein